MSKPFYTGFIYKWTNKLNGKWYLGSHFGQTDDDYIGSGVIFKRAVKAHGLDNFEREILFYSFGTRKELHQIEEDFLVQAKARQDRQSYNMKNKGSGQDPEVASKIWKGRKRTPENVAKNKKVIIESGVLAGTNNARAQKVVRLDNKEIFDYARLAAESVNGTDSGISMACTHGIEHREVQWMYADEWERLGRPSVHPRTAEKHHRRWRVVRLVDGKVFRSSSEAAREHDISPASINIIIDDTSKTAAKSSWMRETTWITQGKPIIPYKEYNRSLGEIVDLKTGIVYSSSQKCADELGFAQVSVMRQAKGVTKTCRFKFRAEWESMGKPIYPNFPDKD